MELQTKIHALKQELETSNFKALYYSTLVKVAEQELGIDIEKSLLQGNQIHAAERPHVPIRRLERLLGFTRQGYYQYWHRQALEVNREEQVIELVKQVRQEHPRIGGRKLYQLLKSELDKREVKLGRDAFFNLLSLHGLLKQLTSYAGYDVGKTSQANAAERRKSPSRATATSEG